MISYILENLALFFWIGVISAIIIFVFVFASLMGGDGR